jgi:hypothetical protein
VDEVEAGDRRLWPRFLLLLCEEEPTVRVDVVVPDELAASTG